MKKHLLTALLIVPAVTSTALATDITAIYGSGNPASGWTSVTDSGIELGLRAKNRVDGTTPNNGAGTYSFATAPSPRGLWNYEFSINSDVVNGNNNLNSYEFYLSVDRDSSAGVISRTVNPLSYWVDNSYGKTGTTTANSGQGVEGTSLLGAANNIVQNSENITFGDYPLFPEGALTLEDNATYTFELYATRIGQGPDGAKIADVAMNVVVGNGGSAVPDSGSSIALLGLGLAGLGMAGYRRKMA